MTVALLLARTGHRVRLVEAAPELGGLWAARLDTDGFYQGENSCKVYQSSYRSAPRMFALIGTRWQDHFVPRHDLKSEWLDPLLADSSPADLAKMAWTFALYLSGLRSFKRVSVEEWLAYNKMSDSCQAWIRATALGAVAGTLRMTVWELLYRFRRNLDCVLFDAKRPLFWNRQPPNATDGFVSIWRRALELSGVEISLGAGVAGLEQGADAVIVGTEDGDQQAADAVFLAVPPPELATLLARSDDVIAAGFGRSRENLATLLRDSVYQHLGLAWFFDRQLPRELPLGGHNVRKGWCPILIQHSQYAPYLRAPAVTAVIGSVSLATDFRHPLHGTRARDHAPAELARILWDDERRFDPALPEPAGVRILGLSSATQIVHHGPLPLRAAASEVYIATSLNGRAPYFTASLESAIQAGAAAAAAFDPRVDALAVGA